MRSLHRVLTSPASSSPSPTRWWRQSGTAAGVPIVPIHFHYPERTIGFGPPLMPGEDMDADIAALRAYYAPFRGKHRGVD